MIAFIAPAVLLIGGFWLYRSATAPVSPDAVQRISDAYRIDPALARAVVDVAVQQGMNPSHLAAVINFESGRTWRANAAHPSGEAVGLIQFRERSAKRLGTSLAQLKTMNTEFQLRQYVADYFTRVREGQWPDDPVPGPLNTLQAVSMAVFYPPFRYVDENTPFPSVVQRANPGITSPASYLQKVRNLSKETV